MEIYLSHGHVRRLIHSLPVSAILISQRGPVCHVMSKHMMETATMTSKRHFWQISVKQREGESIEDFMHRFKFESRDVKWARKVIRISGFMHGITNPELIKRLHDKIPKSVDGMMRITTSVLKEKVVAPRVDDVKIMMVLSIEADHVGSSQNKKSYASSLNGDRDSKVEKQVIDVKGNTLSNVHLTPSLITPALVLDDSCADNILEKFKVIFKGKVYMARAKELFTWTLIFLDHKESKYILDDESLHGSKNKSLGSKHGEDDLVDNSDVEGVSETFFGDKHPSPNNSVRNSSEKDNDHRGVDLNTETDKVNLPLVHTKVMNNLQKIKLQDLKKIIRSWIKDKKLQQSGAINSIKEDLIDIDKNLDIGNVSDEILLKRIELTRQLHDINQMESKDYKHSQLSIRGFFVDGDWNTDLEVVKDVFKDHLATRFKQPAYGRIKLNISFPNRLSTDQVADMDRTVSRDEIRVTIWNYGENKSPGPDVYTFEFFRRYWRFIGSDFCLAVECFFESGSFLKRNNSSFIALIPKVTDAKFVTDFGPISLIGCVYKVVTKILANLWLRKKKQAMIFKVDFAKAYDSVRWDYLLDVLQAFGFGSNWCK
nr:RNA-directed DNA polymerase, eukaryota, reverse transcriptase zinc-binding domain protein [Tanacetum cinerariifolium]